MPLTISQKNLLLRMINVHFNHIKNSCASEIAIRAIKAAVSTEKMTPEQTAEFSKYGIVRSIHRLQAILTHPCPQNRAEDNISGQFATFKKEGYVFYSIAQKDVTSITSTKFHLKNGAIPREYVVTGQEGVGFIAKEPKGILGLTALGPATKKEVEEVIKQRAHVVVSNLHLQQFWPSVDLAPIQSAATTLAQLLINDGRSGNPNGKKKVATPQTIKADINENINDLLPVAQANDKSRALLTLKLLETIYFNIYGADTAHKNKYFKRKNDKYFFSFFAPNISTSGTARSGTEKKHIKLLKELFLANLRQLKTAAPNDHDALDHFAESPLLKFHLSYYQRFATGPTGSTEEAHKIVRRHG